MSPVGLHQLNTANSLKYLAWFLDKPQVTGELAGVMIGNFDPAREAQLTRLYSLQDYRQEMLYLQVISLNMFRH